MAEKERRELSPAEKAEHKRLTAAYEAFDKALRETGESKTLAEAKTHARAAFDAAERHIYAED